MIEAKITENYNIIEKKGISVLRVVLSKNGASWITDLDDTVKESRRVLWADGKERKLLPETVIAMLAIRNSGTKLGVITEQAFGQIKPFISDITQLAKGSSDPYELFNDLIVGEGGSVVNSRAKGEVILSPKRAQEDVKKIVDWLWKNVVPSNIEGWSILNGTNPEEATYVQLPPKEDVCKATASLWEMGPHISEKPEYVAKYKFIELVIKNAIDGLGIDSLTTFEAGNGTLRIVPKFVNKSHSLGLLAAFGSLDLKKTVYSCDGPNDLALAKKIKSIGGGIIAVSNAIPELHEQADYSATKVAGLGFAEAVSLIFPKEYTEAQKELSHLKLK